MISRPVLVPVSARELGERMKLRLGVHDLLDDGEQVEGAARKAVDGPVDDNIAGGELLHQARSCGRSAVVSVIFS